MASRKTHKQLRARTGHQKPFDVLVYAFTILTPLFELPQAVSIFVQHNAGNVSFFTWAFLLISNVVWLTYAVREQIKPLIVSSILYLFIEAAIVIGIVAYR